jgi:hypothetical protein
MPLTCPGSAAFLTIPQRLAACKQGEVRRELEAERQVLEAEVTRQAATVRF